MRRFWQKIRAQFGERQRFRELREEMHLHQQLRASQFEQLGSSSESAAYAADRQFGNSTLLLESARESWRWAWLDELTANLRFAARAWRKRPGLAGVAVLTLALVIGANTAVFSIFHAVLLQPLPYRDPQQLVVIWDLLPKSKSPAPVFASLADFEQLRRYAHSFSHISAATWAWGGRVWKDRGVSKTVLITPATGDFFRTLGVQAEIGRIFTPQDEAAGCALVLSHGFWRDKLGARSDIIGRALTLDNESCPVLGVMPADFQFYPRQAQMWMLIAAHPREQLMVGIFARLKPHVTLAQARAEIESLHRSLHLADKEERDTQPVIYPLQQQFRFLAGRTLETTIWLLSAAVVFVLLIGCLNVANLLLGHSLVRQRELAVRAALGSGRARLVRQLLTESFLLSALGCAAGVMVASTAIRFFDHVNPIELPVGADVRMNLAVLLFSVGLSIGATLLFGLLPAIRASQIDLNVSLAAIGRSPGQFVPRSALPSAVIAAQVGLSVALLIAAAFVILSLMRMRSEPLGYDPQGLVFTGAHLRGSEYVTETGRAHFYNLLLERLRSSPFPSAALASNLPMYTGGMDAIDIEGEPSTHTHLTRDTGFEQVSAGYFAVMKTQLLNGRDFNMHDQAGSEPVAIVNRALAQEYFHGQNALGRRLRLGGATSARWLTIIGVVENEKHSELMHEMSWVATPAVYESVLQHPPENVYLLSRTAPPDSGRKLQQLLSGTDPNLAVFEPQSLASDLTLQLQFPRFRAILFGTFALASVLLAAIGIHGVLAQFVAQRRTEFGVRIAVGAQQRDLVLLIARRGGIPVLAGLVLGTTSAFAILRLLSTVLYAVGADRFAIIAGVILTIAMIAAGAMFIPARRAATIDPAETLRGD
ncbi:MAG TPA: ABC transporter permease [Bryobacteraceae bacterium]|nr:ABC transporter permease [Bryobacteraceae bacterium]